MIKDYSIIFIKILLLIFLQLIVFNNINLFELINPSIYILFFILYRFDQSQISLLMVSFFIGITIDFFSNTAGANTIASITISLIRPTIIKFSLGEVYEFNSILNKNIKQVNRLFFIFLIVFIHQLLFFMFEYFNFMMLISILKNSILNSFFTIIILFGFITLFDSKLWLEYCS